MNYKKSCRIEYCLECGRVFPVYSRRMKRPLCSDECKEVSRLKRHCQICAHCGIAYWRYDRGSGYCSYECSSAASRGELRYCEVCSGVLPGLNKRYCSRECRLEAGIRVYKCVYCGGSIRSRHSRKYCNSGCMGLDRVKARLRVCRVCGKEFVKSASSKGLVCSSVCSGRLRRRAVVFLTCDYCGVEFERRRHLVRGKSRHYCGVDCQRKGQKSGSPKNNHKLPSSVRWRVLRRDGFRCRYCGLSSSDGKRLHVDHILARSNGGGDDLDNLITACDECNLGKSNDLLEVRDKVDLRFVAVQGKLWG